MGFLIAGCSIFTPLQKSKFITVNHLITTSKFNEAKGMIDDLVSDKKSSKWPQTWYYKGLLCQTAHQEGVRKNDKSLRELYPDQLFVAYEAYEKARKLSRSKRYDKRIKPQYVRLVNDLQRLGTTSFNQRDFKTAQRSFEKALQLNESKLLSVPLDTNILHNAAISAYENKNINDAVTHLKRLDKMQHSVNATHLLFSALISRGDSIEAKQVLSRNIVVFPDSDELVLLLADYYLSQSKAARAIETIENALARNDSASFTLLNAKGLVYQNSAEYEKAIEVFEEMTEKFPDQPGPFASIAACLYNIGAEIDEKSRSITNITQFQAERGKSSKNYRKALQWIEKALIKNPQDKENQLFAERLRRLAGSNNGNQP
jgi:tetratricopeptide (TPR) repeat protein